MSPFGETDPDPMTSALPAATPSPFGDEPVEPTSEHFAAHDAAHEPSRADGARDTAPSVMLDDVDSEPVRKTVLDSFLDFVFAEHEIGVGLRRLVMGLVVLSIFDGVFGASLASWVFDAGPSVAARAGLALGGLVLGVFVMATWALAFLILEVLGG